MTRATAILILASVFAAQLDGQYLSQKAAGELRQFETSWLTANLNNDQSWLARFSAGKLSVLPPGQQAIDDRGAAVNTLTDTTLPPNEMKVRISGTISLLTNDPDQNRSYFFLDTFNKIGGKWKVIASSIAPAGAAQPLSREQIETELVKLENEWSRAGAVNDVSLFGKILAAGLVITSADGKVRNREEWMAWHPGRLKSSAKIELQVRVLGDSLAVVTGVDKTVRLDKYGKEILRADRFTNTWLKNTKGRWQCVASQATQYR